MSQTVINGVPETIQRDDYLRLVQSAGFDLPELLSLRFAHNGIYAEVFALNDDGQRFIDETSGQPATHLIFVRVVDE